MTAPKGVTPAMVTGILAAPTPREEVRQRQGPGGKNLDYVDARYVMGKLDELGPENWQRRHVMDGAKVACDIGILIAFPDGTCEWVWKGDGAGETDIEGEKGSFSDAFKRAAVSWGVARDLYPAPHQAVPQRPAQAPRQAVSSRPAGEPSTSDEAHDEAVWQKAKATVVGEPVEGSQCPEHPSGGTWRPGQKGGLWHGPKGIVVRDDGSPSYHSWWPPKERK